MSIAKRIERLSDAVRLANIKWITLERQLKANHDLLIAIGCELLDGLDEERKEREVAADLLKSGEV